MGAPVWESVGRFEKREAIFEMRSDRLEQTEDRVRIMARLMGMTPLPCLGPSLAGNGWV